MHQDCPASLLSLSAVNYRSEKIITEGLGTRVTFGRAAQASDMLDNSKNAAMGCPPLDGNKIEIKGERIRLHGIDAPEMSQRCSEVGYPCGLDAKNAQGADRPQAR